MSYWIKTNFSISSTIGTQWITVPEVGPLSDNSFTTDMPSAFLSVLMPYIESNNTGTMFTCSIDARWAMATYHGGPVGDIDADYIQTATIQNTRPFSADLAGYQYNFLPINDGSWRRVQIDTNWLNTLTPPLPSSTPGWTSLAALLTNMGMDNSTGLIFDWFDVTSVLETIIATLVADGMSRQGHAANGGSSKHFSDRLNLLSWDNSASSQQSVLAGTFSFPPPAGTATQLQWSIAVGGDAYRADSVAYYLALKVLFVHAALALGHVAYILWTRVCCDAWDSFVGLVVLTATSGMSGASGAANVFENASSGIERYRTMRTEVRIRALPASGVTAASQEDVKILFGDEKRAVGYRALELDRAYG